MNKQIEDYIQNIKTALDHKEFLSSNSLNALDKFFITSAQIFHQVSLINLTKTTYNNFIVNVTAMLKKFKIEKVSKVFSIIPRLEICNNYILVQSNTDHKKHIYIHESKLIEAFIFNHIIEGDFIERLKTWTVHDLRNMVSYSKYNNPYLLDLYKDLSYEEANELILIAFIYVAFVLEFSKVEIKPISKASKYFIKPSSVMIASQNATNSLEVSKAENQRLFCLELTSEEILQQHAKFPLVYGYDGNEVDDWFYFRSYAGDRWAVSPSLKIRRKLNISEYHNI
jgi:hypothetical protein